MSTEYLYRTGSLKLPEFTWDFTDHRTFTVASDIAAATVTAGNFEIVTESAIDVSGEDAWPAAGHLCINGRVFTYTSISGDTFVDCNGSLGDVDETDIIAGDIGYQAVPATIINQLINSEKPGTVYLPSSGSGITVTIAPFYVVDGGEELAYAGGTLALTDNATNHVYAYNNGGTITIGKNTTSFTAAAAAVSNEIIQLAVIVTSGGAITSGSSYDLRRAFVLAPTGTTAAVTDHGALTGLSDDDHTQYALLAGRSGGQSLTGGTGIGDDLTLTSTSNATKGRVKVADATAFELGSASGYPTEFNNGGLSYDSSANKYACKANGSNNYLALESQIPVVNSGNRKATFYHKDFILPTTAPGADNGTVVLTTNETAYRSFAMGFSPVTGNVSGRLLVNWIPPGNWNGSTITAKIYWVQGGSATGDVKFEVDARSFADNETLDAAFGTAQSVTDSALNDTTKLAVTSATSAITVGGTPAAGELVVLRLTRLGGDAADTLNRSVLIVGIQITYGINAYSE